MNQDFLPEKPIESLTAQANRRQQLFGEVEQLNLAIEEMSRRLETLQQEKNDLEILLQAATEHSDQLLSDLQRQKGDLKIMLEATTEHSDSIALELRHQAQEERRQREEQFQLITEATPVGLAITDITSSQFLYANEQMGALFGLSAQALLTYQASEFYANVSDRQHAISLLTTQGQFQGEVQFRRVDKTLFWGLLSLRPFRFQGADTLLTALYDIDARKQAEEALRLAEAKYRGIFEHAVEGIFRSTPDGQYIEVNPAMAVMFGYESPEAMTRQITDLSQQIYAEQGDRDTFKELMAQQDEIKDFEYQAYRQDSSLFWVSEWARAVRDAQGHLLYYEGSCVDVTKRKQEEAALKQQLQELKIEIDQTKRSREVAAITETDYFKQLLEEADSLRFNEEL
ncbi:PAS domain-containing protein [Trichocoleus sp. DQ-U1]|uniref:PAS domain-containing protein n=1 Tax=Trichocoleus sp. DQ-U1 TaxID=2933926 RepID=UPI00329A377A